ncbi:MAG: guanylate kinase [Chloroflexi bacterium]|nr:guanylate kinase [Chloroflexota bacterium]
MNGVAPNLYERRWSPLLVVISGPSGVGKDTLLQRLKERGFDFAFVVTMTTRPRRESEVDGRDYFFVSHATFTQMIESDELLEYSKVYGDYKGIPKDQVRHAWASGKDVIMRIDVQGAAKIRAIVSNAVTIFLVPDSEEELVRRLTERKTETPDGLTRRIATAREEMKRLCEFDYVVVNPANQVDQAVDTIISIIAAEHCRVERTPTCL